MGCAYKLLMFTHLCCRCCDRQNLRHCCPDLQQPRRPNRFRGQSLFAPFVMTESAYVRSLLAHLFSFLAFFLIFPNWLLFFGFKTTHMW